VEGENIQRTLNASLPTDGEGGLSINSVTHRRIDILRKLLALSRDHLRIVREEKWNGWEAISHPQGDLYRQLLVLKGPSIPQSERGIIDEIKEVEKQTLEELILKRNETKTKLTELAQFTRGIKKYGFSHQRTPKQHFNINC